MGDFDTMKADLESYLQTIVEYTNFDAEYGNSGDISCNAGTSKFFLQESWKQVVMNQRHQCAFQELENDIRNASTSDALLAVLNRNRGANYKSPLSDNGFLRKRYDRRCSDEGQAVLKRFEDYCQAMVNINKLKNNLLSAPTNEEEAEETVSSDDRLTIPLTFEERFPIIDPSVRVRAMLNEMTDAINVHARTICDEESLTLTTPWGTVNLNYCESPTMRIYQTGILEEITNWLARPQGLTLSALHAIHQDRTNYTGWETYVRDILNHGCSTTEDSHACSQLRMALDSISELSRWRKVGYSADIGLTIDYLEWRWNRDLLFGDAPCIITSQRQSDPLDLGHDQRWLAQREMIDGTVEYCWLLRDQMRTYRGSRHWWHGDEAPIVKDIQGTVRRMNAESNVSRVTKVWSMNSLRPQDSWVSCEDENYDQSDRLTFTNWPTYSNVHNWNHNDRFGSDLGFSFANGQEDAPDLCFEQIYRAIDYDAEALLDLAT